MSISFANPIANGANVRSLGRVLVPLLAGLAAYLIFLSIGEILLRDSDTLWQIRIGQWIVEHGAVPYTDVHTFTRFGEPWMSSSWLSQVLYAVSYEWLGWAGPVILTSLAIGATVTIFMYLFADYLDPTRAILLVTLAVLESATHFLARPHMLAFPFMVAFLGGLMAAADRRSAPSWWLLPVLALWANLHGGFVLGLALIGPIGLEALWTCERKDRVRLAIRWALFGVAARRGVLLHALWLEHADRRGENPQPRQAAVHDLGMDAGQFRHLELLRIHAARPDRSRLLSRAHVVGAADHPAARPALDGAVACPEHRDLRLHRAAGAGQAVCRAVGNAATRRCCPFGRASRGRHVMMLAALAVTVAGWASTQVFIAHHPFSFLPSQTPVAAVDVLQKRQAQRIFSTSPFGGYLLSRDIKAFIDGRAELYGEQFVLDYFDAVTAKDVDTLLAMLDKYQIDATLLGPDLPATKVLDHIAGWKRVYADDIAVIHVRDDQRKAAPSSAPGSSN